MSVSDKIEEIMMDRNTIRAKMIVAGQATKKDDLHTLATNLVIVNTSDATATANDILEGKSAYSDGQKIIGTLVPSTGPDTSDATATADDISEGKTAYVDGEKITGTNTNDADTTLITEGEEDLEEGVSELADNALYFQYTYGSGTDTSDADAYAADILTGKTAYARGIKLTGTCSYDADTSDATAVASDILIGKTAYVNGSKLVGTASSGGLDDSYRVILGSGDEPTLNSIGWHINNALFNSSVTIGENVTDCSYMLYNCGNFSQSVTISNNVIDCSYMFYNCGSFNQPVTIGNNVINCYNMFYNCKLFNQNMTIPLASGNQNSFKNINIREIFSSCSNFNSKVIFDTTGESKMFSLICDFMFAHCEKFNQQINFPNNAKYMYGVFYNCATFNQNIYIPTNVIDMGSIVYNCRNFGSKIFLNKYSSYLQNAYGVFKNCNNSKRKEIYFGSSLNKIFNITNRESIVGNNVTWTSMTNGFYNAAYNVYCYYNSNY